MDLLEVYLDYIAASATETAANGGLLAELAASLAISVDTVARQQQKIKRLSEQVNALKKKGASATSRTTLPGGNNTICTHCEAVVRTAPQKKNECLFDMSKMTDRKDWAKRLMKKKGIKFKDNE